MKKIFFLGFTFCAVLLTHGQTKIQVEASKIIRLIERNLSADMTAETTRSNEFFIYDISIDTNGIISHIDLLRMDSLQSIDSVKKLLPYIIKAWNPVKSRVTKLLVPVLLINGDNQERKEENMGILEIVTLFEKLNKKQMLPKIYVSRMAIITSYSMIRKNN